MIRFDNGTVLPYTICCPAQGAGYIAQEVGMFPFVLSILALLVMAGGIGGIYFLAVKQQASIGLTTVRFLLVVLFFPAVIVLGLYNLIGRETIGPLIGVVVGFALATFTQD